MTTRAHLSSGGVDLVIEVVGGALVVRYWGSSVNADFRDIPFLRSVPNSDYDQVQNPGLMREHSRGWLGYPTIAGHRAGKDWSTQFSVVELESTRTSFDTTLRDESSLLILKLRGWLDEFGALRLSMEILNEGDDYFLNELWYWLPLPERARQALDFAGRWSNERNPQRHPIEIGRWIRDSHEGRSGHNFTIAQIALEEKTDFSSGEAWAIGMAWSGDSQYCIEKNYEGITSIGASEVLLPGEVILKRGESYRAPEILAVYSGSGLDDLAARFHSHIRARQQHPKRPRPLTLNMWEAIEFDHDENHVKRIIDSAAEIGVERIVLDDGWFGSRRSDRLGLGDWKVSSEVWPSGLSGISKYIREKGMEFGLWFEGEMVNPDSDLYRTHPDWILSEKGRVPPTWRHQLVLNIAHPEAFTYILDSVDKVIRENSVSYIKWDHNRTLVDAGYLGVPAVHRQTEAIYRLFDQLKERNPGLEIESCASGGARIDFGVVDHVDRFWVSDNNDALERQTIQRWTMQFFPPEVLGTHIGPTKGNQSGRVLSLGMRAGTALFGHAGIEWDITSASTEDLTHLRDWIAFYKAKRSLIHSGKMVRIDYPDDRHYLYGAVSSDKSEALFNFVQLQPIVTSHPARLIFRELNPTLTYRVNAVAPAGPAEMMLIKAPEWISTGAKLTGDALMKVGLPAPILRPAQSFLIELVV